MKLFLLSLSVITVFSFGEKSPNSGIKTNLIDVDSLKQRCLQGDSTACYQVFAILKRRCDKASGNSPMEKSICLEEASKWYFKGIFYHWKELKAQCEGGDTAACSSLSEIIKQKFLPYIPVNDISMQLYIGNACRCWWNVGFSQLALKNAEKIFGINSTEYNESKTRADLIISTSDSCRNLGLRISRQ